MVFRRAGFSPHYRTYVSIRTSDTSACLAAHLHRLTERSPTQQHLHVAAAGFGAWFSPVTSSAQADSTSELLRFL
ncbi:hypothetical protein [Providencia stuartii]|uniref:hypothetical protein n=1 Tax=Providencia stuartii TaxID=588 RepID=UPI0018FE3963|nr:hypothetical protein [Providencia stuartii]